jgi:glycosyltransferase involved in cell wall biosynthesis
LIDAAEKLKKEKIKFKILLVGNGPDSKKYKKMVNKKHLENEISFLGQKQNPYPYFKISDCLILTSEYEGYPVVFNEAKVLNLPIITTNVSDAKIDIENKYGIVTEKSTEAIYKAMKEFIENGFKIKNQFNVQDFNNKILNKLEKIINGGNNAKN